MGKARRKKRKKKSKVQPPASRWERLAGAVIDALLNVVVVCLALRAVGVSPGVLSLSDPAIGQRAAITAVAWGVFLLLHGYLLVKRGQTIGKVVVGTKIVDASGRVPGVGRIVGLRYLVFGAVAPVPVVGGIATLVDVLFIFGSERRCLHDRLAGTRVVPS